MILSDMLFELVKGLGADIMFKAAGVLRSCFFVNPYADEPVGKHRMALINAFSSFSSVIGEGDVAVVINTDKSSVFKQSHRTAYTGLGNVHLTGDINRTHFPVAVAENKDSFKIVLA